MNRYILVLLFALGFSYSVNAQSPKGGDIIGKSNGDELGSSVSMPDAGTLAIGIPYSNGNGSNSGCGQVKVYRFSGSWWVQKGNDIDGEAKDDRSGNAVSMPDSNTIAIGAYWNDGSTQFLTNRGHVRIYRWNGNAWVQKGSDIDGEAYGDWSGYSVSMPDSNTVAIGAPNNDGNGTHSGHVRIYIWNGNAWVQKGADIDGEMADDQSGYSVSMPDVNTVAVGANLNDGNGNNAGHVRIYIWKGNAWVQKGNDIDGEATSDGSGTELSMPDSNTLAIAAAGNDGNGAESGHVRIFKWNGLSWIQKGNDIDGDTADDRSGVSVSMPDSVTVAIGSHFYDHGTKSDAGQVRVFKWNGNTWIKKGVDVKGDYANDNFGREVCMPDSNFFVASAPKYYASSGLVRTYRFCSNTNSIVPMSACNQYISPSGRYTWNVAGAYNDTIPNSTGCDSIITTLLTIKSANVNVISTPPMLTATATGAAYKWLDCNKNFEVINNATGKNFTPAVNGSYAVAVTQNGCTDTSICNNITNVSLPTLNFEINPLLHPNPVKDKLYFTQPGEYTVYDLTGKQLLKENHTTQLSLSHLQPGIYFITDTEGRRAKIVKE